MLVIQHRSGFLLKPQLARPKSVHPDGGEKMDSKALDRADSYVNAVYSLGRTVY